MMCTMRFDILENTIKINMTQAGGKSLTKTFDRQTALFDSFEQNIKSYFLKSKHYTLKGNSLM